MVVTTLTARDRVTTEMKRDELLLLWNAMRQRNYLTEPH